MKQITKLTTVSRKDLLPGQQAVQATHAAINHCFHFSDESVEWHKNSNYLINLSVEDELSLKDLSTKLRLRGVKVAEFFEPDLDNQMTAVAFLSSEITRKMTSSLPLALKIK